MSYCTEFEVRNLIKDDAINLLVGDPYSLSKAEVEDKLSAIIVTAINDAGNEIDGYLYKRYSLPFAKAPAILNKLAKDIALYNVFSRADAETVKQYEQRYKNTIRFLENVSKGVVSLGISDKGSSETAASKDVVFKSGGKIYSRNSLKGM